MYGRCADWEKAAAECTRLAELDADDSSSRTRLAAVLLKLKRTERFRELCREMQKKFAGSSNAFVWQADAVDDYGPAIEYRRLYLDDPDLAPRSRFVAEVYLGLALFRGGEFSKAVEVLDKCMKSENGSDLNRIRAASALAMAHHERGDQAKAREILAQAEDLYAQEAPEFGVDDPGPGWYSWLICELLLEEAKGKVAGEEE